MMEKGPHPHGRTEAFLLFLQFFMYIICSQARRCFQIERLKYIISYNTLYGLTEGREGSFAQLSD